MTIGVADIQRALALPSDFIREERLRMSPVPRGEISSVPPREAGVLALIYPTVEDRLQVLLTLRHQNLRGHSGQVSFPGGRYDDTDADFTATALRETCEELGICSGIEVLGHLLDIYIPPSNFNVYPTVGYLHQLPPLILSEAEVVEVMALALDDLIDPSYKQEEMRQIQGYHVRVPFYPVGNHRVWGATAIMLGELELRLRLALETA